MTEVHKDAAAAAAAASTLHSPCVCGKAAKKALRRPASHSMLSCRLARAFRSLTSRRISFWGISLSPRFPVSTSDSLAKATLRGEKGGIKR